MSTNSIIAINNFYDMLLGFHEENKLPSHRDEIPCLLAFIAVYLNSTHKMNELEQKFGIEVFSTEITPWILRTLEQIRIEIPSNACDSPVNVQEVNIM